MKLVVSTLAGLDSAIAEQVRSDYIYMYPPRQAYRPLKVDGEFVREKIRQSIAKQSRLNVYVHVPFCHQICGFCNLYTTNIRSEDVHAEYVSRVLKQIDGYLEFLPDLVIPTIYIGGGTPTALSAMNLARLMRGVLQAFPKLTSNCEVAIEVDPQTVDVKDLNRLREIGINRINLGLQTRDDAELKTIGRRYRSVEQWLLASEAMRVGFNNVCVDLIYGLPGQSAESWKKSVLDCIELYPQTICCYPLTERPHTGFAKSARSRSNESDYSMWAFADAALKEAGYQRQSHVRWAREGGGYLQKELHWGSENLIGFGAGARSYLWDIDLRANYSIGDRRLALDLYMDDVASNTIVPREGILMTDDDRFRKAVVLGLHNVDAEKLYERFGVNLLSEFGAEVTGLLERGLLKSDSCRYWLTDEGMKYRDLIVQLFFSDRIRQLTTQFEYNE